jgi:alpha-glucosidase
MNLAVAGGRLLARAACWTALALIASSAMAAASDSITLLPDGLEARQGALRLHVTALSDDLLRVRVAPDGRWGEDASWVVSPDTRHHTVHVQPYGGAAPSGFRTAHLIVRLEREPLRLIIENAAGQLLSADALDRPVATQGAGFELRKQLPESEHFVGLGDKTGPLDRRGGDFVDWNTDVGRFSGSTDPLYKSIPFFISIGAPGGCYGLYLDNTWRSWFDFGRHDPKILEIGASGGDIDYYLVYGPTPSAVVAGYTQLTGRAPLPPRWALGYQQSRYSYMSATEVSELAQHLREARIPTDVIWLDIDYQDRNRPFTTNAATFPDLAGLVAQLRAEDLHVVLITDLHIADAPAQGYSPYDSGIAGDQFVKRPDGSNFVGTVWPGATVFPDFTRAATRRWWGGLYRDFVADGVAGFWNDMNEPALFHTPSKTMPLDTVHRIEEPGFATRTATHAEIHNIYGMENSRATYEGLLNLAPQERPFVMTRASFAGGQRYAVTWTGDNDSSWEHLKLMVPMLLNLGLSGFAYAGADVPGFNGNPTPELATRWFEIAAFTPIFRGHSAKGTARKEPWVDGAEQLAIRRHFIEERYRLMPYLYTLADENLRTGAPLMRPVFYDYPDSLSSSCDTSMSFLLGAQLLVAPSPEPESSADYDVCLPAGRWYDYWSGVEVAPQRRAPGEWAPASATAVEQFVRIKPAPDQLPVYVRAGAILPRQGLVQSTVQTPAGPLALEIYPGENCHGTLYDDDGHSRAFEQQGFLRQKIRCQSTEKGLTIDFESREGQYGPWWKAIELDIHGWQGPAAAMLDNQAVPAQFDADSHALRLVIPDQVGPARLSISHSAASTGSARVAAPLTP